jgi:hypothetical protein
LIIDLLVRWPRREPTSACKLDRLGKKLLFLYRFYRSAIENFISLRGRLAARDMVNTNSAITNLVFVALAMLNWEVLFKLICLKYSKLKLFYIRF